MRSTGDVRDVSGVRLPANMFWNFHEHDECPYCGRLTPVPYASMNGNTMRFIPFPCDCETYTRRRVIFEEEERRRAERRAERRVNIPERFEVAVQGINAAEYAETVKEGAGLYFWGGHGSGKTTIAYAIADVLGRQGWRVECATAYAIASRLSDTYTTKDTQAELFRSLATCGVLFIDDLGKEKPTQASVSMIYRVINDRYERKAPVIVTSNFARDELAKRLSQGDRSAAEAIVSRLCEMTIPIEVSGKDRRIA